MFALLQTIALAFIGIVFGVVVGFGSAPPAAVAPTELVPAILEKISTTTPTEASSSPVAAPPKKPAPKPVPVSVSSPATTTPKTETGLQTVVNTVAQTLQTPTTTPAAHSVSDDVRAAIVNIVCSTQTSAPLGSISASGVMIDSRGVILTNAHVAQFFLLKDYPTPGSMNCFVRTGSPAYPRYTAELLFVPPTWIQKNAYKINSSNPTGNGEHDYALLRITGTINKETALPSAFPYVAISVDPPTAGQKTILAAYPAGFLGSITIATDLYTTSAFGTVGDLYTFESNTLDLFSVGGSVVAQRGSSGGAVADENGVLLGLIVTTSDAPDTASRDLRALSTPYIINDFAKESGLGLGAFLNGDITAEGQLFALGTAPTLRQELINAIQNK